MGLNSQVVVDIGVAIRKLWGTCIIIIGIVDRIIEIVRVAIKTDLLDKLSLLIVWVQVIVDLEITWIIVIVGNR